MGVSALLLDDGHNAVLTDGFFTQPGLLRLTACRIRLTRAGSATACTAPESVGSTRPSRCAPTMTTP